MIQADGNLKELIGALGLPGSLLALVTTAWVAVKFYDLIRKVRAEPEASGRSSIRMSVEEYQELQKTRERIDAAATVIVADVGKTRHDLRGFLGGVQNTIQQDIKELRDVVERIERMLLGNHGH